MRKSVFLLAFFLQFTFLSPARSFAADEPAYHIGREDVLDISVWQSPDLTKTLPVSPEGTISYPILGDISVAGLTTHQLEKTIQEKLAQGYVKDPKVNISIKEYNSKKILVFGEVEKPGLYKLKGNIPLLELLFMVGGVKQDAKRMTVIRPQNVTADAIPSALTSPGKKEDGANAVEVDLLGLLSRGDLSQNIMIMPGDTLYFSSGTGQRYYVLGQIKKPGPYEWVQPITVLEAIKVAGGATERAALNRISVRKHRGGREEVVKVNVRDIMDGKKKDDVIIEAGDMVVLPESWL